MERKIYISDNINKDVLKIINIKAIVYNLLMHNVSEYVFNDKMKIGAYRSEVNDDIFISLNECGSLYLYDEED